MRLRKRKDGIDIKVLSLFDGMACGMIAMKNAGVDVEQYEAFEIDKYAIQTAAHNFPDIKENGNVFEADFTKYKGFDFLIGGSPCTFWSIAQTNHREIEIKGMGGELFNQYLRALHEVKPKYFIYENNKSMSNAIRNSIREAFGFEEICINSSLLSAQNRNRYYWVGKRNEDGTYRKVNIDQPKDLGLVLKDILEDSVTDSQNELLAEEYYKGGFDGNLIGMIKNISVYRNGKQPSQQYRVYSCDGKSVCVDQNPRKHYIIPAAKEDKNSYEVCNGMIVIDEKFFPINLKDGFYVVRKLTLTECMRLQTVPSWFNFSVTIRQAHKLIGNGWTCDVITHLIKSCLKE